MFNMRSQYNLVWDACVLKGKLIVAVFFLMIIILFRQLETNWKKKNNFYFKTNK